MEIDYSELLIKDRFRIELGSLETLKKSIKDIGLLHPVVVVKTGDKNKPYRLVAGRRRCESLKQLGMQIPVNVIDLDNILQGEFDENACRLRFQPSEMVAIKKALEPEIRKQAKERMLKGKPSSKFDEGTRTDDNIARKLNVSRDTLRKAEEIIDTGDTELIHYMDTKNVNAAYRRHQTQQDEQQIAKEKPTLQAKGKYKTIMIDPPWEAKANLAGRAKPTYQTMTIPEIEAIKIPEMADDNSHIYLWVINSRLEEGIHLLKTWGYQMKNIITWCKPQIGLGHYFRNTTEHMLFGVKGNLNTRTSNQPTHIIADRKKHSAKPDEAYEFVEKASHGPYLEIFSRKKRKGWKTLGNIGDD